MSRTLPLVQEVVTEVVTESATMEIALPALAVALAVFGAGFFVPGPVLPSRLRISGVAMALALFCIHVHARGWLTGADRPVASFLDAHHTVLLDHLTSLIGTASSAVAVSVGAALCASALWRRNCGAAAGLVLAGVGAAAVTGAVLADVVGDGGPVGSSHHDGGSALSAAAFAALTALVGLGAAIVTVIDSHTRRAAAVAAGCLAVAAATGGRLYSGDDRLTGVIIAMLVAALVVTTGAGPLHRAVAGNRPRHTAPFSPQGSAGWLRTWASVPR